MVIDGGVGQMEPVADLLGAKAGENEAQALPLPARQAFQPGSRFFLVHGVS